MKDNARHIELKSVARYGEYYFGTPCFALTSFAVSLTSSFAWLDEWRSNIGLIAPAQCVLAANWFPSNERSLLNPLMMSGYSVGSLVSGFTSGVMCSSTFLGGWPSVYYIYGKFLPNTFPSGGSPSSGEYGCHNPKVP
ncbi:inorganic phosphate cotransporter [Trichonephila clavipes]|nr:inorganic phosphate cotransporter [Trichonephila clavipes]